MPIIEPIWQNSSSSADFRFDTIDEYMVWRVELRTIMTDLYHMIPLAAEQSASIANTQVCSVPALREHFASSLVHGRLLEALCQ